MSYPLLDTSAIIRLLTGDDLKKQARSRQLFEQIEQGKLAVAAPATVIADAVYVLASCRLYDRSREEIAALLAPLVRLPGFHVQGRRAVLAALQLYATTPKLDYGDALLATVSKQGTLPMIYSYHTEAIARDMTLLCPAKLYRYLHFCCNNATICS